MDFGPGKLDLAMIMGTGFPPFRGGLLRYADNLHLKTILDRLRELEDAVGARFTPAAIIVRLARNAGDAAGPWPHKVAVEFDEPLPELEPVLHAATLRK